MTIKVDKWLKENKHIVQPFVDKLVSMEEKGHKVLSYGPSSAGVDLRVNEMSVLNVSEEDFINPKDVDPLYFRQPPVQYDSWGVFYLLPPNGFCLINTVETITMPDDLCGLVTLKSSYARCGLYTPPVVFEPGWKGVPTIALKNTTQGNLRVFKDEGVIQVLFVELSDIPELLYNRKYQNQSGITLGKV